MDGDITLTAQFAVNTYKLTYMVDGETYKEADVDFGAITTPEVPEGMKFDGWQETVPETMPAHDVDIHGTYSLIDAISSVVMDADARVTVCTLNGCVIFANAKWADVRTKLGKGLYIINGRKHIIMK